MLGAGLALVGGSAIAAGDWWLAQQPWIGVGLTLLVAGLAMTAVFGALLVAAEPLGSLRMPRQRTSSNAGPIAGEVEH